MCADTDYFWDSVSCLCGDEEPDAAPQGCTAGQHAVQQGQAATSKHQIDTTPEVRQVGLAQDRSSALDLHSFFADLDPAVFLKADPDPA